ncbi:MAG: hypothetical protein EBU70_13720, partial [Actinobacteria bacterium]|nr:hypothetical protein [Actinomycetota bacterium]
PERGRDSDPGFGREIGASDGEPERERPEDQELREHRIGRIGRGALVVVATLASTVLYAILLRILAPAVWSDLRAEIRRILDRFPSRLLGRRESAGRS